MASCTGFLLLLKVSLRDAIICVDKNKYLDYNYKSYRFRDVAIVGSLVAGGIISYRKRARFKVSEKNSLLIECTLYSIR